MYPNLLKLVTSVSSLLGVSSSAAELLLQEFKWSQERLLACYFQSPEEALVKARGKLDHPSGGGAQAPAASSDSCFICMDDFSVANGATFSMACGHEFHR
jgi:hypothetical protein